MVHTVPAFGAAGRLAGGGVAVTVMTNFGFHTAMAQAGIEVATTAVGDRHVLEALRDLFEGKPFVPGVAAA